MPSTFFGLTIAGSGVSTYQTAINTTANNISNVQTEGYSKQTTTRVASDALKVNARYGTTGTGVTTTAITQLRNTYYDEKYWENQTSLGYYTEKLYYMTQIENYFTDDDNTTGFSSLLSKMFNNLNSVKGSPADETVRKTFISSAQSLANYFNNVATELQSLQSSCNDEIKTTVDNINSISQKIALLNKQINVIEVEGGYANELRDQRALLIDELSEIVPVEVIETPVTNSNYPDMYTGATNYMVKINGQTMVDTYDYRTLTCTARDTKINQSDIDGLYEITWSDTGTSFNPASNSMSGTLKALFEMRDGNNNGNFSGKVSGFAANGDGTTAVTFTDQLSITSVEALNMPVEGTITINNRIYDYFGFSYATSIAEDGTETITGVTFNLTSGQDTSWIAEGQSGSVGTSIDAMGIPYYMNQLNSYLRSFCQKFNNIEQEGVDLNGDAMGAFFVAKGASGESDFSSYSEAYQAYDPDDVTTQTKTYNVTVNADSDDTYYSLTALNFAVADESIKDPGRFSASESISDGVEESTLMDRLEALYDEVTIVRGCKAKDFLECILDDVSVDTEEATIFQANYTSIQSAISTQRQSISGVDEDEEALDLLKFQNAYNLSSKVISILTEMYDQLILNTGV